MVELKGGILWSGESEISGSDIVGLHLRDRYFLFLRYGEGGWEVVLSGYLGYFCFPWFSVSIRLCSILVDCGTTGYISIGRVLRWFAKVVQRSRVWVDMAMDGEYG